MTAPFKMQFTRLGSQLSSIGTSANKLQEIDRKLDNYLSAYALRTPRAGHFRSNPSVWGAKKAPRPQYRDLDAF
jgi:hypothetical protein